MSLPPSEFESASSGQRAGAWLIETMVAAIFAPILPYLAPAGSGLQLSLGIFSVVRAFSYRLLGDGFFGGAALGKGLCRIQVVDAESRRPCSAMLGHARPCSAMLGRAVRDPDGILALPSCYFIEPVILACDGQQRWGDRVAWTYVLRRQPRPHPEKAAVLRPLHLERLGETLRKPDVSKKPAEE